MNYCVLTVVYTETVSCRVSIVEFIVGNTVEFMNVTMNPTNNDKDFLKVLLNSLLKTMKSAMNPRNKFKGKSLYHCLLD